MANTVSPSNFPSPQQIWYEKVLLAIDSPNLIHTIAAERRRMATGNGKTWRVTRMDPLPTAVIPLPEDGSEIASTPLTKVDIDVQLSSYGQYVKISEQVVMTNSCPILNSTTNLLGDSMKRTEDEVVRDMLIATATHIDCTAGVNGDSPTEPRYADVQEVDRAMMSNNAWTISKSIEAENKFGTAPQRQAYFAMAHSDTSSAWENVLGFTHRSAYPSQNSLSASEYGQVGSLRVFLSSVGAVKENASALGNDIYEVPVTGMEAYAIIDQESYDDHIIYKDPRYSDALNQTCTLGYKMRMGCAILNDAWITLFRMTLAN